MTGRTRFLPLALLALLAGGLLLTTPSFAQISFVQAQGTGSNTNVAQISATFSSAQQGGDLNVVMTGWEGSTSIQSVTDTKGNTYALAVGPTVLSGMGSHAIYYAKNILAAAAGTNTVTVQFAGPASKADIRVAEYSGVNTTDPFEAGVAASGTGLAMNSGPLTTSNANDLLVAGNWAQFFVELSGGEDYTLRTATVPGSILQDRIGPSAGIYSATALQEPSGGWVMQLAAFKPNDTQPPTTPNNLSATAASSTQVNLNWNASTDNVAVTGYVVERCTGAGCSDFSPIITTATTSYTAPAWPSTSYSFRVSAQDAVPNSSGYSSTVSATTPADTQAPTTPANLTANAVASTQINLSWTLSIDNAQVTNYLVERCEGASCSNFAQIAAPTTTSYNDTGRSASTTYRYRVRAQDAVPNLSGYSSTASATTPIGPDAPTTPTNLSASAISYSQINLSWTASTDNVAVTGYLVERCPGASCSNFTQISTPTTTSYNDTGRVPSTAYRYRIRARDAVPNFSGYTSPVSATTLAAPDTQSPTPPTNLSANVVSSTQINLSWTASTDNVAVTNYLLERCQGASCSNFTQIATPATTSYNDTGRSASTTYRYRVRAQDAVPNFSIYSSTVSATTQSGSDTQAPTTPANLSATAFSSTQINLSWTASTDNVGVTGYLVERCQGAGCSNFAQIATPTTTSYNDTGRSPSTSYSYRVRAQDAVPNYSTYSATASATTSGAGDTQAPTAPSALTGGAISSSQVNLSWTASTDNVGVTGYRVERCTGASCSNFSQIGTPATTSYSDTGLSASTSYRYRVRAADAADNLSGYSGIVAVTTHANSGSSTTTYTYDAAGRLIRAVSSTGRTIEYEYDANGNITVIERQ